MVPTPHLPSPGFTSPVLFRSPYSCSDVPALSSDVPAPPLQEDLLPDDGQEAGAGPG